jgi:lipoprotein-releasing system ATP-binding protein
MDMIALDVQGLSVDLGGRRVLDAVDVQVERGESVAIVGPAGTGKTTLLNCVLGTVRPRTGRVVVADHDMTGLSQTRLARLRAEHLGVVFQHGELLGELTPVENVALPALIVGRPREQAVARAIELLEALGVPTDREVTDHLSGGERQRTALARALVNEPSLVLADEPTGSLDPAIRDRVADVLFDTPARWGCGLLVVTHDPLISARADRIVHLERALAVDGVRA